MRSKLTTSSAVNVAMATQATTENNDERMKKLTADLFQHKEDKRKMNTANRLRRMLTKDAFHKPNLNIRAEDIFTPPISKHRAPLSQDFTDLAKKDSAASPVVTMSEEDKENQVIQKVAPKSNQSTTNKSMLSTSNVLMRPQLASKRSGSVLATTLAGERDDDEERERERRMRVVAAEKEVVENREVENNLLLKKHEARRMSTNQVQAASPTKPTRIRLNVNEDDSRSSDESENDRSIGEATKPKPVHLPVLDLDTDMKSPKPTKQQQRGALGDLTKNTTTSSSSKNKPLTSTSAMMHKMMPSVGSTPKSSAVRESRNRMSLSTQALSTSRLEQDELDIEPVAGFGDMFNKRSNDMPPPPPALNINTPFQSQESERGQKKSSITITKNAMKSAPTTSRRIVEPVVEEDEDEDELFKEQQQNFIRRKSLYQSSTMTISSMSTTQNNVTSSQMTSASAIFKPTKILAATQASSISIHQDKTASNIYSAKQTSVKSTTATNNKKSSKKHQESDESQDEEPTKPTTTKAAEKIKRSVAQTPVTTTASNNGGQRASPRVRSESATTTLRQKMLSDLYTENPKKSTTTTTKASTSTRLVNYDTESEVEASPIVVQAASSKSKESKKIELKPQEKETDKEERVEKKNKTKQKVVVEEEPEPETEPQQDGPQFYRQTPENKAPKSSKQKSPTKKSSKKEELTKKRRDASIEIEEDTEVENLSTKRSRNNKEAVQPIPHDEMIEYEQEEERYNDQRNVADKRLKENEATKSPTKKSSKKEERSKKRRDASIEMEEEVEQVEKKSSVKRGRSKKEAQPLPHDEMLEEEDEEYRYNGLRRSKRQRVDKNSVPEYAFETITDFEGKRVRVKKLVGKHDKPNLFPHLLKQLQRERERLAEKKKKAVKAEKPAAKNNHDDQQHRWLDELMGAHENDDNQPIQPINDDEHGENEAEGGFETIDIGDEGELTLMDLSQVNTGSDKILIQEENNQDEMRPVNFYCYWKNIAQRKFTDTQNSVGVQISSIYDNDGFMKIEPLAATKTISHDTDFTLIVQQGKMLISINESRSIQTARDIVRIPTKKKSRNKFLYSTIPND